MNIESTVNAAAELRTALVKATVYGDPSSEVSGSLALAEEKKQAFGSDQIEPPYNPDVLYKVYEYSNALRQNVEAYQKNIDGFGHRFEPVIDFSAGDVDDKIREALLIERATQHEPGSLPEESSIEPTDEEVAQTRKKWEFEARIERARLEAFFDTCAETSFVQLRERTRQDREITGSGYWEIIRDGSERIAQFEYVPSATIRLLPVESKGVPRLERVNISPVHYEKQSRKRRLRKYVQVGENGDRVYFKQFGDPRIISKKTGKVFESVELLKADDPDDPDNVPANELFHFCEHWPLSPYGMPRWVGVMLSVVGSRHAEEVNVLYFKNRSIPPLAILVSGGRLGDNSVDTITKYIEEEIKGKENFHKILVLEAESTDSADPSRVKIELHPLTDAQQQDALFQNYDERNIDKIGAAFRVPPLLRGEGRDFNRAVADAQLRFAEDQVFQPLRDDFDYTMNRWILADMGIRFWRFRSQTPITRDPERLATMIEKLVRVGVVTPEEARKESADVFNRELAHIDADWTKRPITLTLGGIQNGVQDLHDPAAAPAIEAAVNLQKQLQAHENRLETVATAREELAKETETIQVPKEAWDSFEIDNA